MTSRRSLVTLLSLLALLVAAPTAGAIDTGGGVAVQSFEETGGGIVAPAPRAEPAPAEPPVAEAAQETPTTPEGEEQPPDEEEPPGDDETPDEEVDPPPPGDDDTGGGSDAGALPQTGLELLALSAIGLGLLLAGGALWPTRSWPPPRDPLSRSTPRR